MAIDYGRSKVGLAISDPTQTLASSLKTVRNGPSEARAARCLDEIVAAAVAHDVVTIVLGLPLRTDGRPSQMAEIVKVFAEQLEARVDCPIILLDERFTTKIASRYLSEVGRSARDQRGVIDERSAELLLQDYLERLRA